MKTIILSMLFGLLTGCATDMVLKMPMPEAPDGISLAQVRVSDLRAPGIAASKREAAFGVPMGNISFNPTEPQLVKRLLEVELTRRLREKGVQSTRDYVCELVEFGVNTNTTALYWDVVGRVRLLVKQGGKDYPLAGTYTERTYLWPGEQLITRVVGESLRQIGAELGPVAQGE